MIFLTFSLAGAAAAEPQSVSAVTAAEVSELRIPLEIPLLPLAERLERNVPAKIEQLDAFELEPQRRRYGARYVLKRERLRLSMSGSVLEVATRVYYGVEACRRTYNIITDSFTMWPCGSCGLDEPKRAVDILLHSRLDWDRAWMIRSKTHALPSRFPNRCDVNIDMTDRVVAPQVAQQLRSIARSVDLETPKATNFRSDAERIWNELQVPQLIATQTWLVIEPLTAALSPIEGKGTMARTTLTLRAATRVVVGAQPQIARKPLPFLGVASGTPGFRVPMRIDFPFSEAARLLLQHSGNMKSRDYDVQIRSVVLRQIDSNRVAIEADARIMEGMKKRYDGRIDLVGRIVYDPALRVLRLADLDYALKTKNILTRLGDFLVHGKLRDDISSSARWSLGPLIDQVKAGAHRSLNRPLGSRATLQTKLGQFDVVSVEPAADRFVVRIVATGDAQIHVSGW